ncbi:MAG: hypothetical protein E3J35_03555 [Methanomassiliicoccales archaeon]|nr:MAG: hypothetical protein E3J35_03555 [Methanomassiliicoccales archaeon]
MAERGSKKTPAKESRSKPRRKAPQREINRRYMLLELSCAERHCDPCTYPNCQRFTREMGKKERFTTRMFELRPLEKKGRVEPDRKYVAVELACKDRHCNPCTYPNCQRYVREFKKKERFTTPLFEMSRKDWKKARKERLSGGEEAASQAS